MNWMRTTVLLAGLTALLLVFGQAIGGQQGVMIALVFAVVMNLGSYWFSDRLVLAMYRAREVGPYEAPQLHAIVQGLAQRAGLPMPRVYLIDTDTPNAFATGRSPANAAVAATTGLMRILTREELAGVMAHELAHVQNRDTLVGAIAATLAGAIAMLANMVQWALIFGAGRNQDGQGGNPLAALAMAILAPFAAMLIQMAVSRSREYAADTRGARICGNPLWLANALRKLEMANRRLPMVEAQGRPATAHLFIVNPLNGRNLAQWFSTHPPIEERVRRLEAMAGTASRVWG